MREDPISDNSNYPTHDEGSVQITRQLRELGLVSTYAKRRIRHYRVTQFNTQEQNKIRYTVPRSGGITWLATILKAVLGLRLTVDHKMEISVPIRGLVLPLRVEVWPVARDIPAVRRDTTRHPEPKMLTSPPKTITFSPHRMVRYLAHDGHRDVVEGIGDGLMGTNDVEEAGHMPDMRNANRTPTQRVTRFAGQMIETTCPSSEMSNVTRSHSSSTTPVEIRGTRKKI